VSFWIRKLRCERPFWGAAPTISLHHAKVKYDGYRLRLERDGDRVRLITRGGYNWADRYPRIAEAALKNRRFVIEVSNPSVGEHPHGGSRDRGRQCRFGNQ
jgi:hypothetical protein